MATKEACMFTYTGFNRVSDVFYVLEKTLKRFGNSKYFESHIQNSAREILK